MENNNKVVLLNGPKCYTELDLPSRTEIEQQNMNMNGANLENHK